MVTSEIPVNTFAGELHFDPAVVAVETINYQSSIANLWVNAPTFENESGTIHFIGGTTKPGGFTGSGALYTITFRTRASGFTTIGLTEASILQSDGYGTPADMKTLEGVVISITSKTITQNQSNASSVVQEEKINQNTFYEVGDLNKDSIISFSDIGVFFEYLNVRDIRADLNQDGHINEHDLNFLIQKL